MRDATSPSAPRIEIGQPRLLTAGGMLVICAYSLLLMLPVLIAMLSVSISQFGIATFLVPMAAIAAGILFLPFGFGNPYVAKLVRSLNPTAATDRTGFVVQLSLTPRLRSGMRAILEDADDIGWLRFAESTLVYQGDSIRLSIPFEHIRDVRLQSSGWRGLFLYGPRTTLAVSGLSNATSLQFAERSSWLLPGSRRIARALHKSLIATQRQG